MEVNMDFKVSLRNGVVRFLNSQSHLDFVLSF